MSTLRVSNIEAKADVSSPSVNEKVKVTNSNGELLIHIDGATSGITTVGISTSGESFRFDSNQNVTFFGSVTGTGLDVNGNADISGNLNVGGVLTYEDVTNIDSVGVVTARNGLQVTGGSVGIGTDVVGDKLVIHQGSDDDVIVRVNGADSSSEFAAMGVGSGYAAFVAGGTGTTNTDMVLMTSLSGVETERLRIDSNGSALLTTDGQSAQYSYAMKLGQSSYNPNDATGPHYGLWVRQLGPRYELNYGVYSEIEDDSGFYGGETLDGLTSVRGVGVYGASTTSTQAYQKGIGVYGKAFNTNTNYNTTIGVRGRAEIGTTTFTNNNGQQSFGGHFVATGKADCVGVYADAYLDGSPGANQVAIPLLVSSNGSERLRVDSSARVIIDGSASGNNKLQINGTGNDTAFVRLKRTNGAGDDSAYGGMNVIDNNNVTIGTAEFRNQDSTTRSQFVLSTYNVSTGGLAEAIRVKANGRVGINVTSPEDPLHVKNTSNAATSIRIQTGTSSTNNGDEYSSVIFDGNGYVGAKIASHRDDGTWNDRGDLRFYSGYGNNVFTQRMRITNIGGVVIGSNNNDASMSEFGSNTGGLTIDDAGVNNTGIRLSHGNDDSYLVQSNNGNFYISQYGTGSMIIGSGSSGTERLRISGNATAVHVKGESALTGTTGDAKGLSIAVNGANSCPLYFGTETNSAQKSMYLNGYWIYLRGHQNEGIRFVFSQAGGNAPRSDQYQFKYNQATRPTGNTTWDGFSDRRAKENIQDVTSALDTIGRLRPVTFDWTNDYADRMNMFNLDKTDPRSYMWTSVKENGYDETRKNNNVGFIAQEFEEVFPKDITETEMELGDETITDFKTVNFDSLVPMLTKAVQELKAENDAMRACIAAHEDQYNALADRITALEP